MDKNLLLALYGAITSSIAICWNIYNSIIQNKGKLKIERQKSLTYSSERIELVAMISCKVTNIGRVTRYIEMPMMEYYSNKDIDKQALNDLALMQIRPANQYPKELKPGEVHAVEYNLNSYYDKVLNRLKPEIKLYFYVCDTHGKKYSSDNFSAGELVADVLGAKSFIRARLTRHSN